MKGEIKEGGIGGKSERLGGGRAERREHKSWKNMEDENKGRGQRL